MNTLRLARYSETTRKSPLTCQQLQAQNQRFKGTCGISQENRSLGFLPAFVDTRDGKIYLARFADGRLAPMHLLDGLPETVIEKRDEYGKVIAVKDCVIAGFVRDGHFYTREQAAQYATKH